MPIVLTNIPVVSPPPVPRRKHWTREQCAPLEAAGLFKDERLELIEGELISKMGKNLPHVNALMSMLFWLAEVFGKSFVNAEAPIDVSPEDNPSSEPEPDLIVMNRDRLGFSHNPRPGDLSLVVEISDSTLNFDLTVKAGLYARAGISEFWALDLNGRCLLVHRNPVAGRYSSVVVYNEDESPRLPLRNRNFVRRPSCPE
jgi:Uma2 family endonuclease